MKNPEVKSKYNIKFNLTQAITHKLNVAKQNPNEIPVETDINKWNVTYYSDGRNIKGIIETATVGMIEFENRGNILSLSETGELLKTRREGNEIPTNIIMGYFEYSRSINSIEEVGFNEFHNFPEKSKKAIYKNIVALIEKKLDQERFEAYKKQNS